MLGGAGFELSLVWWQEYPIAGVVFEEELGLVGEYANRVAD